MSKFGKKPIYLPQLLKTEIQEYQNGNILWISGPNATIYRYWRNRKNIKNWSPHKIKLEIKNSKIQVKTSNLSYAQDFYKLLKDRSIKKKNEYTGLLQGQIQKTIVSAMTGYKKYLMIRGVGYKFIKKGRYLSLQIGYSHKINIILPSDLKIKLNKKATAIKFQNYSDTLLHGLMSKIRNYKKPDVYKGKGIRYKKDTVIHKEGKKKKTF